MKLKIFFTKETKKVLNPKFEILGENQHDKIIGGNGEIEPSVDTNIDNEIERRSVSIIQRDRTRD